ncbi:MAG: group 1 glycosyl transferase [Candidatus Uhrbacteria bacterium GW2011_GWF2_41_16]|uniref:Group 1 glycosyl transferase n=2 Tax=Candidatus Uhriibacteriota TaxID=1752732 RepID=A0A0G0V9F6_9BACT|nr:MAG: group 1 glycosyl transferase [Candidatus Uhrbacteria bacterium GW2011_GWA2_41_10]KKR87077.1 MAG: group 1 glycosyl transferase [Candidatus Uhrbacteria bacterium GW2011_GWC2_41_11]KKR97643.1 MAG: group 1 glycosyl transferase [Candidatus Uhrbacteria bacterium GW2011_GWF2_41_16]HBP00467.1 hypothetical protein [Candidatus Uhrbacteria bacterium]
MKIVLANKFYFLKGAGAEQYVFDLEHVLNTHGHTTIPFAMQQRKNHETPFNRFFVSSIETEKAQLGLEGLRGLGRMVYSFESAKKMRALIQETHPDLCHIHNIYYQISPSILSVLHEKGIPMVMTVHDYHLISPQYMMWSRGRVENWRNVPLWRSAIARFHKHSFLASAAAAFTFRLHERMGLYRLIDRYIAPTHFVKHRLVHAGFPAGKIQVLPFGIDAEKISPRFDDDGYILFVGRLVEEKGIWTLLRAAKEMPDISFKIVGTGPEEKKLHLAGDRLSNVEFLGFRNKDEIWDLYRGARCVVVPSLWYEVFGLVALEAMAVGKPVVASHIGGLPEIVSDRTTGLLFPPGNTHALVETLRRLVDYPSFAHELGVAGRERVLEDFSFERHYHGLMEVYEDAMSDHWGKKRKF